MWNFIPELFYDFLARIVPGAIIIVTGTLVALGPTAAADFLLNSREDGKLFGFGPVLLWVLASYLTGLVLGQLWEISFGRIAKRKQRKIELKCKEERLAEHNKLQKALGGSTLDIEPETLPRAFVMRDHLRYSSRAEALRLLKIRAEGRSSQVFVLGFILMAIVNAVYLWEQPKAERIVLEIFLIVAVAAFLRMVFRLHRMLVNGTMVSWLMCVSPGKICRQGTTGKMADRDGV